MSGEAFPYEALPRDRYWRTGFGGESFETLDPQGSVKWHLDRSTRIASAGSCFGRRIGAHLTRHGFTYLVTEPGPAMLDAETRRTFNYGVYSARYGDVYSSLQLLQLLERALGRFVPQSDAWPAADGTFLDPFRPVIAPRGFASITELQNDRAHHLRAVERALREADVFIFTLGLTEIWIDRADGAVLPHCPGRGRGEFDADRYAWHNLDVDEVIAQLEAFLALAHSLNPSLRVILTVSPVPLAATLSGEHIVRATVYSKSVLRVAAETVARRSALVDYFASYELGTSFGWRPPFFDPQERRFTDAGVDAVMRVFYRRYAGVELAAPVAVTAPEIVSAAPDLVDPCDEAIVMRSLEEAFDGSPFPIELSGGVHGYIDSCEPSGLVQGWAIPTDAGERFADLELVEGPESVAIFRAQLWRGDVDAVHPDRGHCGFRLFVPEWLRDGTSHTLDLRHRVSGSSLLRRPFSVRFDALASESEVRTP